MSRTRLATDMTPTPPNAVSTPGELRRLGTYRILRKLAQGGMSSVYVAYDEATNQTVALKVLSEKLQNQPEFVRRFRREARLMQLLRHPNIVRGIQSDYDRDSDKRYLSMELVDGPTAAGLLQSAHVIPGPYVARIGIEIAAALGFLHGVNFVHRDVKPENILLDSHGTARLTDFGLIKKIEGGADLTASNQGVGTPYYMPYEQIQNSSLVDGRSDLFALGASLYHMATGQLPFPGRTEDEIDREKKSGTFRVLSPHLSVELAKVLTKAMSREVRDRYQSAYDLIHDLEPFAATSAELAQYIAAQQSPGKSDPDLHAPTRPDLTRPPIVAPDSTWPHKAIAIIALAALVAGSCLTFGTKSSKETDACDCNQGSEVKVCCDPNMMPPKARS